MNWLKRMDWRGIIVRSFAVTGVDAVWLHIRSPKILLIQLVGIVVIFILADIFMPLKRAK